MKISLANSKIVRLGTDYCVYLQDGKVGVCDHSGEVCDFKWYYLDSYHPSVYFSVIDMAQVNVSDIHKHSRIHSDNPKLCVSSLGYCVFEIEVSYRWIKEWSSSVMPELHMSAMSQRSYNNDVFGRWNYKKVDCVLGPKGEAFIVPNIVCVCGNHLIFNFVDKVGSPGGKSYCCIDMATKALRWIDANLSENIFVFNDCIFDEDSGRCVEMLGFEQPSRTKRHSGPEFKISGIDSEIKNRYFQVFERTPVFDKNHEGPSKLYVIKNSLGTRAKLRVDELKKLPRRNRYFSFDTSLDSDWWYWGDVYRYKFTLNCNFIAVNRTNGKMVRFSSVGYLSCDRRQIGEDGDIFSLIDDWENLDLVTRLGEPRTEVVSFVNKQHKDPSKKLGALTCVKVVYSPYDCVIAELIFEERDGKHELIARVGQSEYKQVIIGESSRFENSLIKYDIEVFDSLEFSGGQTFFYGMCGFSPTTIYNEADGKIIYMNTGKECYAILCPEKPSDGQMCIFINRENGEFERLYSFPSGVEIVDLLLVNRRGEICAPFDGVDFMGLLLKRRSATGEEMHGVVLLQSGDTIVPLKYKLERNARETFLKEAESNGAALLRLVERCDKANALEDESELEFDEILDAQW